MTRILVYTPKQTDLEQILAYSSLFDFELQYCQSPAQALAAYARFKPQCFIVQCEDKAVNELKLVKSLSSVLPIFAVTSSNEEIVALRILDCGADYLVHLPCGSIELYYQLKNFLRLTLHAKQANSNVMHLGDIQIFLHNNQVIHNGQLVTLTATEFKLLLVFAHNLNKIITIEKIYHEVYPQSEVKYTSRALNMHISNLRHKLNLEEFAPLRLETRRGVGFGMFFNPDSSSETDGGEQHA